MRRDPQSGEVEVLLSQRSKDRIAAKIRELTPRTWGRSLADCIHQANEYLLGWIGFFRIVAEAEVRTLRMLDSHLRRRLRAILLRQWKRRRTIARRLIGLGMKFRTAWSLVFRRGRSWWWLSGHIQVNMTISPAWFAERKLLSLATLWEEQKAQTVVAPAQLTLELG